MEKLGSRLDEYFPEDPETLFTIPRYQRGYSWKKDHVTDFLNDIEERMSDNEDHYYGTFFSRTSSNKKEIIDGQQRITTVILYFIGCRDFLTHKLSEINDPADKADTINYIKKLDKILTPSDNSEPRILKVGKINEDLFDRLYSYDDPDSKKTKNKDLESDSDENLMAAYKEIIQRLETDSYESTKSKKLKPKFWEGIASHFNTLLKQFRAQELTADSMSRAFKIFETINDRGEPLAQSDLIKNYFFSELADTGLNDGDLDKLDERWSEISQRITADTKADYEFDHFVRHVLLVEYDIEEKKDDLYKGLQQVIKKKGKKPQEVIAVIGLPRAS